MRKGFAYKEPLKPCPNCGEAGIGGGHVSHQVTAYHMLGQKPFMFSCVPHDDKCERYIDGEHQGCFCARRFHEKETHHRRNFENQTDASATR